MLRERQVPPVYGSVNAAKLEGTPDGADALRHWVAAGERIGYHAYSHPDLNESQVDSFLADARRDEPVLELLAPGGAWRWFRFPYLREGDTLYRRRAVRSRLLADGYRIAQVTIDWEDYLRSSPYARCVAPGDRKAMDRLRSCYLAVASAYLDANRQMAARVFGHPIRHVQLLHLGLFGRTVLPDVLDLLAKKGITLVSLEEAERDPAHATDPDAASRDGGSLTEQWLDKHCIASPPVPEKSYRELEHTCD
jgi:peptidoglycan/xylan/chitin deacetylase (PgdA/CDA1 family)